MKTIKKIVSSTLGISVLFINALPVFAKASTDQTLISTSMDTGLKSVDTTASIITDSLDSLTIEKTEQVPVYEAQPEYIPVYSYAEPYVEVQEESTTMTVEEFMALYGQTEEAIPVDTSSQEDAYQLALANYNSALAEYEAASQMVETTKDVEVEIIEEVTDEEGNVSEVTRTEIQTVTEMVPAGDVETAKVNLDAAKAALDAAQMALDSVKNTTVQADTEVVEPEATIDEDIQSIIESDSNENEQTEIDEDVVVKEDQTYASSGTCGDGVYWSLDSDDNLTISGSGNMYSFSRYAPPWPNTIKTVTVSGGISIGSYAFASCNKLTTASIPSTCKIGANAFMQCSSLKSITIPSSQNTIYSSTFSGCTSLTSVTIPSSIIYIETGAFWGCSSLTSITIPKSVTSIGSSAFTDCTHLKDVYYQGTQQEWSQIVIDPMGAFPTGVTMHYAGQSAVVSVISVSVTPDSKTLSIGETCQLTATVSPTNATNKNITWTTSDSSVATVSSNGLVRALKVGSTVIAAHSVDGNQVAYCSIDVKNSTVSVTGISLNKTSATLKTGETLQLSATISPSNATNKNISWGSTDSSVAKVSSNGLVTAVSPGTITIIAQTFDGSYRAYCTITVQEPVTGVSLDQTSVTLNNGETLQLTATVSPSTASNKNVSWSSSNTSVATVSSDGLVKGIKEGTAVITVTTEDGNKSAKCTITVLKATSGKCGDNLYWELNGQDLLIYGDGDMSNYSDDISVNPAPWGQNIKSVKIISGATSIGQNAFDRSNIESVNIADTVKTIGRYAFYGCSSLTSIEIPNSVTAIENGVFDKCTGLTDVYYQGTKSEWSNKNLYSFSSNVTMHFIGDNLPFKDVYTDDWYYSVAKECYETGLINGTSATTFSPMQEMTRAMVVTILWRMEGQPSVTFNNKFSDVSSKQWYATSISWAEKAGVVHGYGDGTFKPDAAVTREQVAVMLANYATYKGVYEPGTKKLNTYPDGSQVSNWAQSGMKWALTNGIISGNGEGYLRPKKSATRAEGAAMLLRMQVWMATNFII